MAVLEYNALATKAAVKDGKVIVTSAVEDGQTVRIVYGLAQVAVILTAAQQGLREVE